MTNVRDILRDLATEIHEDLVNDTRDQITAEPSKREEIIEEYIEDKVDAYIDIITRRIVG